MFLGRRFLFTSSDNFAISDNGLYSVAVPYVVRSTQYDRRSQQLLSFLLLMPYVQVRAYKFSACVLAVISYKTFF